MDVFEAYEKERKPSTKPEPAKLFEADKTGEEAPKGSEEIKKPFEIPAEYRAALMADIKKQILEELKAGAETSEGGDEGGS